MGQGITYIGLDVHKTSIHAAVLRPGRTRSVEETIPHEKRALGRWVRRWSEAAPGRIVCAYEAGPTGYALQRELVARGWTCQVVAPALIPRKPGERIKTDRRDARKLAELLRGKLLTEVRPPSPAEEAARDLCRAREDAKQDRMRCRHRLTKFLLRRGITWTRGRKHWTQAHHAWLRKLRLEHAAEQAVLEDYLLAVEQLDTRLADLGARLEALSQQPPYAKPVGALRCFRGIDTVTAMTLVAELHGIERFRRPRQLMAYLGLVPSEHSSGDRRRRGGITKAGNGHARRVLIESAWHARHVPAVPRALAQRRRGQPGPVVALADRAQRRLHHRYWRLIQRGKAPVEAVTAVARELTGFVWAALHSVTPA